ncbi:MAG: hypothetical protein JW745_08920 [Sedimentisphaerales bacterium]|nr:hypothetical protein [Sedimentisphaerales bacterium]MBN2841776.1 hypothetical protein [Sedimentisphaerales bacterium]
MYNNKNRRRAFTIIEVLLASMLLAVGLFTLFMLADRSVHDHKNIFTEQLAARLADEVMVELNRQFATELKDKRDLYSGTFTDKNSGMSWQAKIMPTDSDRIYKAEMTITDAGADPAVLFSFNTYLFK